MPSASLSPILSIVLPAYNERENLRPAVADLLAELRKNPRPFELIVVDDGSQDGTGDLADEIARNELEVRVVHHPTNLGLGGGYRTGFREARGDLVMYYPADGQYSTALISEFEPRMANLDVLLGYLPQRGDSLAGTLLSQAERIAYRILFGPMPRFNGMMMFRRRLLDDLPLLSEGRGWGVIMEFILRAARGGYRIQSVPITVRPRQAGESKVRNLRTIWSNTHQLWMVRKALSTRPTTTSSASKQV